MSKSEMWQKIQEMAKSDPIVAKAFSAYATEDLEDQAHILIAIVIAQSEVIEAMKITQQRLLSDYYKGAKACLNYAEIQQQK